MDSRSGCELPDFVMFTGDVIYTGEHADGPDVCVYPFVAFRGSGLCR